jgi:hypothetical protein
MNSEIRFALDGLVAIIWKSETEELEDCGVCVLSLQYKIQRSVQNQNEVLIESVRCDFECYVTPSLLLTV